MPSTGISIISVIFAEFFPYIYMGAMRILVPVSLIAFIGFLITRIRSKGPSLTLIFGIWLNWLPVTGWGDIPGDKILLFG